MAGADSGIVDRPNIETYPAKGLFFFERQHSSDLRAEPLPADPFRPEGKYGMIWRLEIETSLRNLGSGHAPFLQTGADSREKPPAGLATICDIIDGHADWTGRWWSMFGTLDLVPMGRKVILAAPALLAPFREAGELAIDTPTPGSDRPRLGLRQPWRGGKAASRPGRASIAALLGRN